METSRDQTIIHSLVEIADNLVENFDVVDLLDELDGSVRQRARGVRRRRHARVPFR